MKDLLDEHGDSHFYIGLKYSGGNVLTYDDKILGTVADFEGSDFKIKNSRPAIMVSEYKLHNLSGTSERPFICQHN